MTTHIYLVPCDPAGGVGEATQKTRLTDQITRYLAGRFFSQCVVEVARKLPDLQRESGYKAMTNREASRLLQVYVLVPPANREER